MVKCLIGTEFSAVLDNFEGGEAPNAADLAVFGIAQSVAGLSAGSAFSENPVFDAWMKTLREILICEKQIV